jgi:hypothetical protein
MSPAEDWQGLLAPLLRPGEQVLWSGAPVPGVHQRGKAAVLMIFGLPFLMIGLGLFVSPMVRPAGPLLSAEGAVDLFLMVLALPFAALGGFLVFGPWIEARTSARLRHYVLTDRAAFVLSRMLGSRVAVYPILPQTPVILETGRRAGTVWVHARRERVSDGGQTEERAGFENIAEAEHVARLIRSLQEKASA